MAWFLGVGTAAAGVHWCVVVALVSWAGWPPLLANVLGWLVAFGVSYGGHRRLTFRHLGAPEASSAWRFFCISAAGFAVNEACYAAALHWGGWRFDVVLGMVLVGVAGLTYVASRYWAFARRPG